MSEPFVLKVELNGVQLWTLISLITWYLNNVECPRDFKSHLLQIRAKLFEAFNKVDC